MNALDWSVLTYKQVWSKSWTFLPYCIAKLTPIIMFIFSHFLLPKNMSLGYTIISFRALVPSIGIVFPHGAFICATIIRRTSTQPYKPNVKNLLTKIFAIVIRDYTNAVNVPHEGPLPRPRYLQHE